MPQPLHYAYIDEAGNVAPSCHNHVLVVAALGIENSQTIARIIRKTQKKYGSSLASGELKAKKEQEALTEKLLSALAKESIEVHAVIIDRQVIEHPPQDPEDIYRWTMARLAAKLVRRYPRIEIVLDRRYTREKLRCRLESAIRERICGLPQEYVMIRQEDSIAIKELQAVDFIAWALFQKYERHETRYYERIIPIIIEEEVITKEMWEQEQR